MNPALSTCLLITALLSAKLAASEGGDPGALTWNGAGSRLTYQVAEDEVELVRRPSGGLVEQKVLTARGALPGRPGSSPLRVRLAVAAPQAQGYQARVREVERLSGAEAWAVLYLPGQPRGNGQGAVLARNLIVRVAEGVDIAGVVQGLDLDVLQRAPHDTRSWVCHPRGDDPLAAPTVAALVAQRAGVEYASPILHHVERTRSTNDPELINQKHLLAVSDPSSDRGRCGHQHRRYRRRTRASGHFDEHPDQCRILVPRESATVGARHGVDITTITWAPIP